MEISDFLVGLGYGGWKKGSLGLTISQRFFDEFLKWQPTPVFLPGKSHERRSLAGYSPQGHKDSDTTEHTHAFAKYCLK